MYRSFKLPLIRHLLIAMLAVSLRSTMRTFRYFVVFAMAVLMAAVFIHPAQALVGYSAGGRAHASPTPTPSYDQIIINDKPSGFWALNDAVGSSTAVDSSGNGHNCTVHGTVTFGQTGGTTDGETAALFDGSTGYLTCPTGVLTIGNATVTIEMLVKMSASPIGMFDSNPSQTGSIRNYNTGNFSGYNSGMTSLPASLHNGSWHLFEYLTTTTTNSLGCCASNTTGENLYFQDGSLSQNNGNGGTTALTWGSTIDIGTINTGLVFYAGTMAKVAIYPYALSPTQIAAHFAAISQ